MSRPNVRAGALIAALLSISLATGCWGGRIAKAPEPEDEVARLTRNVTKARFAQEATKELIERSRGQAYLADLYLRLAELYVEEARYHYFIAYEGQKKRDRVVTSVQAKLLKDQAIAVYERILGEFPDFVDRDKVLFFIAHEHRELGDYEKMLGFLNKIIVEHPKSKYRNEALIVVGDHHFDKRELDVAEKNYRLILETPESPSHAMARYKAAWVRVNKEDFKGALGLFEDVVKKLQEGDEAAAKEDASNKSAGIQKVERKGRKIDLRREALVDLVYPYTEVNKKPTAPLKYFRGLADSRTTYLAALNKLGRRWYVKGEYGLATEVYRELLTLGADSEDSVEWAQKLYDGVTKGKKFEFVATDVTLMADVLARRRWDWRLGEKERANLTKEFETYARDLATKAQLEADTKKDLKALARAADAYQNYLQHFSDSEKALEIRQNLAEARFSAKQWLPAGRAYEAVMEGVVEAERQEATFSAVTSYANAMKEQKLTRLELVQARAGLRHAARVYFEKFPKAEQLASVKFNYAKSFYDEGRFEDAAELFAALVQEYPTTEEASIAAELALDALRAKEDFEELARLGKQIAAFPNLPAKVKDEVLAIVAGAETRALDVATLKAGAEGDGGAVDGLLAFADSKKGTDLGEKALVNAFVTARNTDDLEKVTAIGDRLLADYPKSEAAPDVLATLGKMSAQAVDFERAAKYLEDSARRRPKDPSSLETLKIVGTIKAQLGDIAGAKGILQQVIDGSPNPNTRRDAALALSELLERGGDFAGTSNVLTRTAGDGPKSARLAFRLGYALWKTGYDQPGDAAYQQALDVGQGRTDDPDEADGAAGAAFFLGQAMWEPFAGVQFGGDRGEDAGLIREKFATLAAYEEAMLQVIQLQSPNWALAALSRLAAAYEAAAKFLEGAPTPPGLDGAGAEKYKAALGGRAEEYRGKAKEALATCASKAAELRVFTPAAKACAAGRPFDGDPYVIVPLPRRGGAPAAATVAEFRARVRKNSKDYEALVGLAGAYLQAGDPMGARLILDKATEGGADAATFNMRGAVAFAAGLHQDAYADFKKALDEDPTYVKARLNMAALYRAYGYKTLADGEASKVKSAAGLDPRDPALISGAGGGR